MQATYAINISLQIMNLEGTFWSQIDAYEALPDLAKLRALKGTLEALFELYTISVKKVPLDVETLIQKYNLQIAVYPIKAMNIEINLRKKESIDDI